MLAQETAAMTSANWQKKVNLGQQLKNQMRERLRRAWFDQEQELAAEMAMIESAINANVAEKDESVDKKVSKLIHIHIFSSFSTNILISGQ